MYIVNAYVGIPRKDFCDLAILKVPVSNHGVNIKLTIAF